MKATLFIAVTGMFQLALENGEVFDPQNNETIKEFKARISEEIEGVEIKEVALKSYKRLSTTKLNVLKEESVSDLELEVINTVLEQRSNKSKPKADKSTTKKSGKSKAEKKPKKESTRKISEERLEAIAAVKASKAYKDAKKHVGNKISFKPARKGSKQVNGTIKNLSLSKDLSRIYFSVEQNKTKKRVCCSINNESVKIG